jgi:hypothetical protein
VKIVVCLRAGASAPAAERLHPTDARAVSLGRRLGAEIVALELVATPGAPPVAAAAAVAAGADMALRLVDRALGNADAAAAGLVLATVLRQLGPDLTLFGTDADPEGLGDVPGAVAHQLGAAYLVGLEDLAPAPAEHATDTGALAGAVAGTFRSGGLRRRLRLGAGCGAVLGLEPSRSSEVAAPRAEAPPHITVLTLADLGIDPALVRRRDDLRGTVETTAHPLDTLTSRDALATLLRSGR